MLAFFLLFSAVAAIKRAPLAMNLCTVCTTVVGDAKSMLDQHDSEAQISAALDSACDAFGAYQAECRAIVAEYLPAILAKLRAENDVFQVCSALRLCHANVAVATSSDFCGECQAVVSLVESFVERNSTETQIRHALDKVCGYLHEFSKPCAALVDEELPVIIKDVEDHNPPKRVCQKLHMCPKGDDVRIAFAPAPLALDQPLGALADESSCTTCKQITALLQGFVANNVDLTDEAVKRVLFEACALTGEAKDMCEHAVVAFLPEWIKYITSGDLPEEVCSKLTMCAAPKPMKKVDLAPAAGFCSTCEFVVNIVESYLERNTSIAVIEKEMDQVCDLTPYAPQCKKLIKMYLPAVIHYIERDEDPATICKQIGACANANEFVSTLRLRAASSSEYCVLCEEAMGFLESWATKNTSEHEIANYLENVCAQFPAEKDQCDEYVEDYLPLVLEYIRSDISPKKACTDLRLCESAVVVPEPEAGACTICEAIASLVESYASNNATEHEIAQAVARLCDFTGSFEQECKELVAADLPRFIEWALEKESPQHICDELGLCSNAVALAYPAEALRSVALVTMPFSDTHCQLCKTLVSYVQLYLEHGAPEKAIEDELKQLCQIAGDFQQACESLVETYTAVIIKDILDKEGPDQICYKPLDMCPKPQSQPTVAPVPAPVPTPHFALVQASVQGDAHCQLCKTLVSYVELYLQHGAPEKAIEDELKQLCKIAGDFEMVCDGLVETYTPVIIQDVLEKETPDEICYKPLGMCPKPQGPAPTPMPTPGGLRRLAVKPTPELCSTCELIVSIGDHYAESEQSLHFIEAELEKVCAAIPAEYKDICDSLVTVYVPVAAQYLARRAEPGALCAAVGLCRA